MNIIALVPARSGSHRLPNKNIRILGHHPLIAYSIAAAQSSGIFSGIYCSSDSDEILAIAHYYGAIPIKRPADYATDTSPDADWIRHALSQLYLQGVDPDCFMILRPTSPFRTADTIQRAWDQFKNTYPRINMKAVEPVSQHPGKMWIIINGAGIPALGSYDHLLPTQTLSPVVVQNACLEIRWNAEQAEKFINIRPFYTDGCEGTDINDMKDWVYAEYLIRQNKAELPEVNRIPYDKRNMMEEMYGD